MVNLEIRKNELEAMDWTQIRDIAQDYGMEKPAGGWKDAIPLILERESLAQDSSPIETPVPIPLPAAHTPVLPVIASTEKGQMVAAEAAKKLPAPPLFATAYYQQLGLAVCSKCGAKRQKRCAIASPDCPFKKS